MLHNDDKNKNKNNKKKLDDVLKELFSLIQDFSFIKYFYLMEPFSMDEKENIKKIFQNKYKINLREFLPKNEEDMIILIKNSIGKAISLE